MEKPVKPKRKYIKKNKIKPPPKIINTKEINLVRFDFK
jgi:hypothetical protein